MASVQTGAGGASTRRVLAASLGVYEVTQKKDTLTLWVQSLGLEILRGMLTEWGGRVVPGAGAKPYLAITLREGEAPLDVLKAVLQTLEAVQAAASQA